MNLRAGVAALGLLAAFALAACDETSSSEIPQQVEVEFDFDSKTKTKTVTAPPPALPTYRTPAPTMKRPTATTKPRATR